MKLVKLLTALLVASVVALMYAGLPLWLCAWVASFEYGVTGLFIWIVVQPGDMSVPRALFLWWPAMWFKRRRWLKKGGW